MSRKDRSQPLHLAGPEHLPVPLEDNIHRLREMLALMAPERSTPALGASIVASETTRVEHRPALPHRKRTSDAADAAA